MGLTRPSLIVWCVGAAIFILALFRSLGAGPSTDWASSLKASSTSDHGRQSLREQVVLAEKIWAKTVMQRHELLLKDWPAGPDEMPFYPCRDHDSYKRTPYSIWDFVPASYSCPHEVERIGKMGDGGKWVCGMSVYENQPAEKPCIIYSFGVNDDSSFEEEMLSRTNCEIWAYDFSVDHLGPQITGNHGDRAHFMKVGIGGETDVSVDPPFHTIADLMKMNGHDYIDILKIDIEGFEYPSLTRLSQDFPASTGMEYPIGQMMIEIHLFRSAKMTTGEFLKWWELLESRGMRPTWTEPNLLVPTLGMEGGMPAYSEYTFINAKHPQNILFAGVH